MTQEELTDGVYGDRWSLWAAEERLKQSTQPVELADYKRWDDVREFQVRITKIYKPTMDYVNKEPRGWLVVIHGVTDDELALPVGVWARLEDVLTYLPNLEVGQTYPLSIGHIRQEIYDGYRYRYTKLRGYTVAQFENWYRQNEIIIKFSAPNIQALDFYISEVKYLCKDFQ